MRVSGHAVCIHMLTYGDMHIPWITCRGQRVRSLSSTLFEAVSLFMFPAVLPLPG